MPPAVDYSRTEAATAFILERFRAANPGAESQWLERVISDVDAAFRGKTPRFHAVDLPYHDRAHTLMVAVCLACILEGAHGSPDGFKLTVRQWELAMAAAFLHDIGYLRERSDTQGTGAKYTAIHIPRGCAFAAEYLSTVGAAPAEIEDVLGAIHCTAPLAEIARIRFHSEGGAWVGCSLATADYVCQLADPAYPGKLGALYREFCESDAFMGVPQEKRLFKSEEDLLRRTPGFWRTLVRPKLHVDFKGACRFLERPLGSGQNGYLDAVESNIAAIERRVASLPPA